MKYMFTAIIHQEDNKYYASVPDIPGCITTGNSVSDAIDEISDALAGCLCVLEDEGASIPVPTTQNEIEHELRDICTIIRVDTLSYRALTDTRAVRKNVSIPAWMATRAEKLGINCSKVLQDALMQHFA